MGMSSEGWLNLNTSVVEWYTLTHLWGNGEMVNASSLSLDGLFLESSSLSSPTKLGIHGLNVPIVPSKALGQNNYVIRGSA